MVSARRRPHQPLSWLAQFADCGLATGPFAAVGFCFGGLAALTLARSGADLARRCGP